MTLHLLWLGPNEQKLWRTYNVERRSLKPRDGKKATPTSAPAFEVLINNTAGDSTWATAKSVWRPCSRERTGGKFWLNCIEAKYEGKGRPYTRKDFDHGLGEYAGVTDMPCCFL